MLFSRRLKIALVTGLVAFGCLLPGVSIAGQDSDRAQKWEFYIPLRFLSSESWDAEGGSSVRVNGDVSWGFGFGYNLNERLNLGFELTWSDANFDARIATDDLLFPFVDVGGQLQANTGMFQLQYNFLAKKITPFFTGGLGWTYVDSNIPTGPAQGGCWWDPWYGQICTTWQPTAAETGFSYAAGLGVRADLAEAFFVEAAYNRQWMDFDGHNTVDFPAYRVDFGWKF